MPYVYSVDNNDGIECTDKGSVPPNKNGVTVMASISVKKVAATDLPGTNHKGRTRKPTDFDEHMVILDCDPDDAWLGVEYDGTDETLGKLIAELTKASNHFGVGVDKRHGPDAESGIPTLFFRVRERAIRTRKENAA